MFSFDAVTETCCPLLGCCCITGRMLAVALGCRVVAARARGESLSDEVAALELEECPIRMAAHPSGQALVLALGSGGLARVNVARGDGDAATSLSLATGVLYSDYH